MTSQYDRNAPAADILVYIQRMFQYPMSEYFKPLRTSYFHQWHPCGDWIRVRGNICSRTQNTTRYRFQSVRIGSILHRTSKRETYNARITTLLAITWIQLSKYVDQQLIFLRTGHVPMHNSYSPLWLGVQWVARKWCIWIESTRYTSSYTNCPRTRFLDRKDLVWNWLLGDYSKFFEGKWVWYSWYPVPWLLARKSHSQQSGWRGPKDREGYQCKLKATQHVRVCQLYCCSYRRSHGQEDLRYFELVNS